MKRKMKVIAAVELAFYYAIKLVQSNLFMAYDIVSKRNFSNPGKLWVPIRLNTDFGLLLLSNLISMTPGTFTIDYSEQENSLLVHYMYGNSESKVAEEIEKIQEKVMFLTNKIT